MIGCLPPVNNDAGRRSEHVAANDGWNGPTLVPTLHYEAFERAAPRVAIFIASVFDLPVCDVCKGEHLHG